MTTRGMTLAAVGIVQLIADINRMNKLIHYLPFRNILLNLTQNLVAKIAILGN